MKIYKQGKYTIHIHDDGSKWWYYDKFQHRENGPAVVHPSGVKEWWISGRLHREDGPALQNDFGLETWWIDGKEYSKKEWEIEMRKRKLDRLGI